MFTRPEVDRINKCSMFLCGITLGFIRFYLIVVIFITLWMCLIIVYIGADPDKPLSRFRRFLVVMVSKFFSRSLLFTFGYFWINTKKVNICHYDMDYP